MKKINNKIKLLLALFAVLVVGFNIVVLQSAHAQTEESGSVGLTGHINSDPPKTAPTITVPVNGAVISQMPTTVSGLCPDNLLVKVFKNGVFAGSTQCKGGSYSVQIDLFFGRNELIARAYDDLDQASPDSNMVVATYPFTGVGNPTQIILSSPFAKRGANPGQTLTWPLTLTGGNGPYAITVDWGDGKPADIISLQFPGNFNATHVYDSPGIYNVIIRATDRDKNLAFLQVVGIANGPVGQNNAGDGGAAATITRTRILWQPAAIAIPLLLSSFWLGKRYELYVLRKRLENQEEIS